MYVKGAEVESALAQYKVSSHQRSSPPPLPLLVQQRLFRPNTREFQKFISTIYLEVLCNLVHFGN
jgi:hypothetical protein